MYFLSALNSRGKKTETVEEMTEITSTVRTMDKLLSTRLKTGVTL